MDDELLQEFIDESREHLATIETDLLAIEAAGANADVQLLNKVFRAAHSIKGAAGFFNLVKVKELAHKAETVLDMLRSRKMSANAEITNVLLRSFDKLRDLINAPAISDSADTSEETHALVTLAKSYALPQEKPLLDQKVVIDLGTDAAPVSIPTTDLERTKRTCESLYHIRLDLIHDVDRQDKQILKVFGDLEQLGEIVDCRIDFESVGMLDGPVVQVVPLEMVFGSQSSPAEIALLLGISEERIVPVAMPEVGDPSVDTRPTNSGLCVTAAEPELLSIVEVPSAVEVPSLPIHPSPAEAAVAPPAVAASAPSGEETLRVNVGLLDTLMNLAGELVLSRNQFQAAIVQNNQRMLSSAGQRLSQITSEMQDAIMRTRLQPIENVFSRLPRVVRDLSNSLGKEVILDIGGKEVSLDRSLVEGLSDPLTHMVRNAIDHGIEMPEVRIGAGKTRAGTLRVDARHEAGQVLIEISDDGKGIDHEKVAQAALAKGLITAEQLKGMTTEDRNALILLPGLSTAERVTQVSGRGVGMDVVKTNLDRLGGQIEISSQKGQGTVFRIKLPLTLTIIPALIVSVAQERFAIPQINVEELLRIRGEERHSRIEVIGGTEVLVLRDCILPLLSLAEFLDVQSTFKDAGGVLREDQRKRLADRRSPRHPLSEETAVEVSTTTVESSRHSKGRRRSAASALEIAVVTTGTFRYGIVVESFHNTEEIVVKPLGRDLKESREYAGATILGDGAVALILDAAGLALKAELSSVSASPRAMEHAQKAQEDTDRQQNSHSFLLFRNAPAEQCAIPLEMVRRIERIKATQLETLGDRRTMQYRDCSLPLVSLSDAASVGSLDVSHDLAVIVSTIYGHEIGLLGGMPVDVFESDAGIDTTTHRQPGISGSTIIRNQTTLLVDLMEMTDAVYPEWHVAPPLVGGNSDKQQRTVLLAEDSDFFRTQVTRYLQSDGHEVIGAVDGEDAWELLLKNLDKVQLVVTDVEMPRLTGLELSARIRADARTAKLPIIALSSLAGEEDMAKAKAAGVNEYKIKLDRDELLEQVKRMLPLTVSNATNFAAD